MDLEAIMPSEMNQSQKDIQYDFTCMRYLE